MRKTVEAFRRYIELLKAIDGKTSVYQLAKKLNWRPNTVLAYVEDLKELGLIEIRIEPGAPPRNVPVLTEKGRCILKCFEQEI